MRLVSVVTSTLSPRRGALADLGEQVVDLVRDRADLDLGIEQAGRADDLLDDDALGLRRAPSPPASPRRRSSARARCATRRTAAAGCRARSAAGTRSRRASPCASDRRCTSRRSAAPSGATRRRSAGSRRRSSPSASAAARRAAPGQVARVVLDARAEAHLLDRLEIVHRALLEALPLEQLALRATAARAAP